MPTLASELRNKLERVVIEARDAAEVGARAALEGLAVHHHEPYPHMKPAQRELRNHLRARARQLGDRQDSSGRLAIGHLAGECAYEHWHRMLFARFLAENGLLIEPEENMAISLAEAEELAKEEGVDVWVFASRCAQRMLPQIFRPDDPLLQVAFATEHMLKLEELLASLPAAVFTASDALGWVYQFWQSKKKDEVNRSEVKIGADEISAVTQLFTEPYMVEFLLHNTLGAWHAGKVLPALSAEALAKADEASLRKACALPGVGWEYLRFVREDDGREPCEAGRKPAKHGWRPAAGTFDGWPKTAAEIRVLDPCCGSGHFLVAALHHLVPIRMAEEGLAAREAVDAVLRDNLHGLEIDERCCQIAAFALALAAWTYPDAGGYRPLPELHIACTGIGPQCSPEQWLALAEQSGIPMPAVGREAIRNGLLNLHRLFSQAPTLGSLIDPTELPGDLIAADYETIQPYLAAAMSAETRDYETHERAVAAAGMVKAADLLAGRYAILITNVPYLGRGRQDDLLKCHLERHFAEGTGDLATAFVLRCISLCRSGGTSATVTPQNWLFLTSYRKLRETLLKCSQWNCVARLGSGAFEGITGHVVNVALPVITSNTPALRHLMAGLDVSQEREPSRKAATLRGDRPSPISIVRQADQLKNPDARLLLDGYIESELLSSVSDSFEGLTTGDAPHYIRKLWEVPAIAYPWAPFCTSVDQHTLFGARDEVLFWENGTGTLSRDPGSFIKGKEAWGRFGLRVTQMSKPSVTIYSGELFDKNAATVVPTDDRLLPALWAFATSPVFPEEVRRLDPKLNITIKTFVKVPFDLAHWQKAAAIDYPDGLPEPESDDPTQWLFHGWPGSVRAACGRSSEEEQRQDAAATLQVAVARLLGYRWPAEQCGSGFQPLSGSDQRQDAAATMRLSERARALVEKCGELARFADPDGIVCIPAVRGEDPAADRLLKLLGACGGSGILPLHSHSHPDLDAWLRDGFFEEHCKLFHHRPFIWHIWDGRRRDGFGALVNYHRLCEGGSSSAKATEGRGKGRRLLESLTYAYLGEWITRQKDGVKRGEGGAEDRLAAALELQKRLEAILAGEPPFDIFVRWKPLAEQPIGWEPDINDGVRVNIRPFLASDLPLGGRTGAGILRWRPKVKWDKDRGKEPDRPKAEYPWFWGWDGKRTVNHIWIAVAPPPKIGPCKENGHGQGQGSGRAAGESLATDRPGAPAQRPGRPRVLPQGQAP